MTTPRPTLLQCLELPATLADRQAQLNALYHVVPFWQAADPQACLAEHRQQVKVLATSAFTPANADFLAQFPALQAICNLGVGYDNIDIDYARTHGIVVSNTPDVLDDCVADLAWGLVLSTLRGMGQAERYIRNQQWTARLATLPLGRRVTGKRLGIVGLGRIGMAIAQRAQGFAMPIRYHNRHRREDVALEYADTLLALAAWADVLVVTTTGGVQTRHLIDATVLRSLGANGFLINISRGSVVDESALIAALQHGSIAGAGLDVYEQEPHVPEALLTLENVVLMPHIGSATQETRQAMFELLLDNLCDYAQHARLRTEVTG